MANPDHLAKLAKGVQAFSNWKNHDSYQEPFQRLISDLKASDTKAK